MIKIDGRNEYFCKEGEERTKIISCLPELDEKSSWWIKDKLVFVGIYQTKSNDLVYCVPKYIEINDNTEEIDIVRNHMKQIVRVIDKLRENGKNIETGDNLFDANQQNIKKSIELLSVAKFIIKDYMMHGLYVTERSEEILNGNGRSRWAKTVNKILPVIENSNVIYLNVIKKRSLSDNTGLISQIHRQIISDSSTLLLLHGLKGSHIKGIKKRIDLKSCVSILQRELNQVYEDRQKAVLKAMISWCQNSPYYCNYTGTTDFANVWEWVNDAVWGNVGQQNSSNPIYQLFGTSYKGVGDVRPDTLYVKLGDAGKECIVEVFDSKYYSPSGVSVTDGGVNEIYGMPASSDIAKQIAYRYFIELYCEEIKKKYKEKFGTELCFRYANHFLLPYFKPSIMMQLGETTNRGMLYERAGKVSVGAFPGVIKFFDIDDYKDIVDESYSNNELLSVDIILVNPDKLYCNYLSNPIEKVII